MMTLARRMLDDNDCTLVVANHGEARKYHQRGVADLLSLLTDEPDFLTNASVADKIIGKAAAALMIEGGVGEVFTRVITRDAKAMLTHAGIALTYETETDIVQNRTKTGRCPLDTLCADLSNPHEMLLAIRGFLNTANRGMAVNGKYPNKIQ
ncbi:MAG: DUF1893 domain-containing protein [Bacteroidaceae bacterium]|nr:DUF1893 domain-containing protein [Bacteroidaceae bacterium]